MKEITILWTDDEIDLLKPHILFLENKGYKVITATNGDDAVNLVKSQNFDLIFLDEHMPGLSGLETLNEIKTIFPNIPVVMITKSEEEDFMDEAIGSKIVDYLIKPVNPNQILLTIKKNVDHKRLITKKTTSAYQTEFSKIGIKINESNTISEWIEIYKNLIFWELELEKSNDQSMDEVMKLQKVEANNAFSKFIKSNYISWFEKENKAKPLLSPNIFKEKVFPLLNDKKKVILLLIDNLRLDQWKTISPDIGEYLQIDHEDLFCSILPTSTQYARNAMFAGLMPFEISEIYPELWLDDDVEGGKNLNEEELLKKQLVRLGIKDNFSYVKVNNLKAGKKVVENLPNYLQKDLVVIVYNFVDILSHARTEMEMIRELTDDESAYRSLTLSWFRHSPLFDLIKALSILSYKVIITTDHGTIRVNNALKVVGDKKTSLNLRYKQGKNLNYNPKEVFEVKQPSLIHLPKTNVSSTYIFARNDDFFAYPNNFNYYVKYYKNTFQHGGISLEEMIIPVITLSPKV